MQGVPATIRDAPHLPAMRSFIKVIQGCCFLYGYSSLIKEGFSGERMKKCFKPRSYFAGTYYKGLYKELKTGL